MTEEAVVEKVSGLMSALDDVEKYKELARAMVDFVAIFAISIILALLLNMAQGAYDVAYASTSGTGTTLFGGMPAGAVTLLGSFLIPVAGILVGVYWVNGRVARVKGGAWKETLREGTPGAVKLLTSLNWDSVLSNTRISRVAFLLYAVIKVAGYTIVLEVLLSLLSLVFPVPFYAIPAAYLFFLSLVIVLILTRKSLTEGFQRLVLLDQLFWDLRVFSTEFNRAEFVKA